MFLSWCCEHKYYLWRASKSKYFKKQTNDWFYKKWIFCSSRPKQSHTILFCSCKDCKKWSTYSTFVIEAYLLTTFSTIFIVQTQKYAVFSISDVFTEIYDKIRRFISNNAEYLIARRLLFFKKVSKKYISLACYLSTSRWLYVGMICKIRMKWF